METKKAYELPKFECQVIDLDYLIDHIEEYDISGVELDLKVQFGDINVEYTDINHPIVYTEGFFFNKTLVLCKEFYLQNKMKCDLLIQEICKKTKNASINIRNSALINDSILNAILDNPVITEVYLGSMESIYELDVATYEKFKGTHVESINTKAVCPELAENFDSIIYYNQNRTLIGYNTYETLSKAGIVYLTDELTDEEIYNIKHIKEDANITIKFNKCRRVVEILNRLNELGRTGKISIDIENKNEFNEYLFSHINEFPSMQNIVINKVGTEYDLTTYLKYEKRLIDMIRPALGLSPFERYLYAYNVTKQFKEYRESEENRQQARNLYQLLDNDFMVCVGYSKLLGDLLDKLGIENYGDGVTVDVGLDNVPIDATIIPDFIEDKNTHEMKEVTIQGEGHARRKVHLVDPKYGIDGYYMADPTWDNDLQHDTYNFALMTIDEYVGLDRYNYLDLYGHSELFFAHSLEEFYQKLNILLDKNPRRTVLDFISSMFMEFEILDKDFAKYLESKFPSIDSYKLKDESKEVIQDILLEIGEHIIGKNNNMVNGMQFREGIRTLYETSYGMDLSEVETRLEETMELNKKRHEKAYPRRYKIDKYGNEMVVLNAVNKFDFDQEEKEIRVA